MYDVYDRLLRKQVDDDGNATIDRAESYVYDGDDVVQSFDGAGSLTHRYLHGPAVDQVFADEDAVAEILWGLADNQGTIRDVVNYDAATDTTTVVDHREYTAFGELTSDPSTEFRYFYTGGYFDEDSGLLYRWHRWYDAKTARWMSEDWIIDDTNTYRYVGNSSPNFNDPSGLAKKGIWQSMQAALGRFVAKRVITEWNRSTKRHNEVSPRITSALNDLKMSDRCAYDFLMDRKVRITPSSRAPHLFSPNFRVINGDTLVIYRGESTDDIRQWILDVAKRSGLNADQRSAWAKRNGFSPIANGPKVRISQDMSYYNDSAMMGQQLERNYEQWGIVGVLIGPGGNLTEHIGTARVAIRGAASTGRYSLASKYRKGSADYWNKVADFKYDSLKKLSKKDCGVADTIYDRFREEFIHPGVGKPIQQIRNVRNLGDGLYDVKHRSGVRVYIDSTGHRWGFSNKNNQDQVIRRIKTLMGELEKEK